MAKKRQRVYAAGSPEGDMAPTILRLICLCLTWLVLGLPAQAMADTSLAQQREIFVQTKTALQHGKQRVYQQLKARLKHYPLYPYLDIWEARRQLQYNDHDLLARQALQQHADIPEVRDLRIAWIKHLAKHHQWAEINSQLQLYPEIARTLPQTARIARWHAMPAKDMLVDFSRYWSAGGTITSDMHIFEQAWHKAGHPDRRELWARIGTIFKKGHWKEATRLAKALPKQEQGWLQQWKNIANHPDRELAVWPQHIHDHDIARMIAEDGLHRLARIEPALARIELQRLSSLFTSHQRALLQRSFALRAAKRHQPEAMDWLAELPADIQNDDTRAWQARMALIREDWTRLQQIITAMPPDQASEARWIYWHAKALQRQGKQQLAHKLLTSIADERGYYSFLSAHELGLPYQFGAMPLPLEKPSIQKLEEHPAMIRAHEWWLLHESNKATREWMLALQHGQREQWQAAAVIAKTWGWHTMAIRAVARAGQLDALDYRFPLAYESHVKQAEQLTDLDDITIWSIIRQESAFNDKAISRTGARGLMQLMPATARQVAKQLHLNKSFDLFDPATNIRLGSTYLSDMLKRFGHIEYAAAAYNAGPHRVQQWLTSNPVDNPQIWVESIPFNETRRYVQQVMAFRIVYDWRKEKKQSMTTAETQAITHQQHIIAKRESVPAL